VSLSAWTKLWARAIGTVAPRTALRYIQHRMALEHYTGATPSGPNRAWRPSSKSADAMLKQDAKLLRARSRDLVRSYGQVAGAVGRICNNVIFKGFTPQFQNPDLAQAWTEWAKAVSLLDKVNLALRHLWMDGEILIHYYLSPTLRNKGIIPLGIELLEIDHLDESVHGDTNAGTRAKRGIEYNREGWPVYYNLFNEHPGDSLWGTYGDKRRVPAREIEHVFVPFRASQSRGEPWMAPAILEIRDSSEYRSNERLAMRLASAFGIFIKTNLPEAFSGNILGGDGQESSAYDGPDYLEPARIQPLPPGTEVQTAKMDRPSDNFEPYMRTSYRDQSLAFGMSYEAYSNDYTGATYSSARSASLEERRGYQVQQEVLANKVYRPTERRFKSMGQLMGMDWTIEPPTVWQVPGWPWVDPDKDSKGAERDIKNGVNSRHKVCADRGRDYDEVQDELEQEAQDGYTKGENNG